MSRPLIIAGHASGVGKTTLAIGLMGAFRRQGFSVAPFKVGPDYIDTGYHRRVTGLASRNLDTWLTSPEAVRAIYRRGSSGADVSVVEGVMGLFDGRAGGGRDDGSTAEVARLIHGAVVLVVNCGGMSRSLAPLLAGFDRFDERLALAGVILNNVGGAGHARMLRAAAVEAGVPVLGEISRRPEISLGSRHLGLIPAAERRDADELIEEVIDHVEANVDLAALMTVAEGPGVDDDGEAEAAHERSAEAAPADGKAAGAVRIAVARDEAFSFYYEDGLEALEAAGARLAYFSPLRDGALPGCDGLYLGGGFPEMFAGRLEENASLRREVAAAIQGGLPTYAECGGMVYLCRGVKVDGRRYQMAGAIASEARMNASRQALGYVEAKSRRRSIIAEAGERIRGHEFHWSSVKWRAEFLAYDCFSGNRPAVEADGYCHGNLLASYVHIHFAGQPAAAGRFVQACARERG